MLAPGPQNFRKPLSGTARAGGGSARLYLTQSPNNHYYGAVPGQNIPGAVSEQVQRILAIVKVPHG